MEEKVVIDPKDAQDNKIMGILAYFGPLVFVPILAAKESPFAKFHANQGLILFIAWFALYIAIMIIGVILPWRLESMLYSLIGLGTFAFAIIGILNAVKGEAKELPFIGQYKILK